MATKKDNRITHKTKTAQTKNNKKATKKQAKVQSRRSTGKASYQEQVSVPRNALSYEEIVIKNIVSNSNAARVPEEAVLMSSAISSMSGGMKELHYRSGISIGRALYKMSNEKKNYTFPEESVADLVAFFESAGHRNVSYRSYPGDIEIKIHEKKGPEMGTNLHSFEAGIISGFLSAAEQKYVNVSEESCVNASGSFCKFSAGPSQIKPYQLFASHTSPDAAALDRFADHIAQKARTRHDNNINGMANEYYLLSSSLLLDRSYLESIKSIAAYMGKSVGEKILTQHNGRVPPSEITNAIRLLNLGNPIILDTKPFHMELSFDKVTSRKEFIDVSLAFVNGLLSNRFGKSAVATEHSNKEDYIVDIRESKT
ncbi:MAG: hypothetical protein ACHQX1_00855 [Candidatus Micrarchaeales archaeon]